MASHRISPTAHYTGHVWARNGLAHPALAQAASPWLFRAAEVVVRPVSLLTGSPTVEDALLQRHRGLDTLLERAIAEDGIAQVVEVPGGLASRGRRFVERHRDLVYVEGDLPGMARRKQAALADDPHPRHHVLPVDLLAEGGPLSLAAATRGLLDPGLPTAMITEGLLYYLDAAAVRQALRHTASFLHGFPRGIFLADLSVAGETAPLVTVFLALVSVVARGRVQAHFDGIDGTLRALEEAGFDAARVLPAVADPEAGPAPGEVVYIHLLEARSGGDAAQRTKSSTGRI